MSKRYLLALMIMTLLPMYGCKEKTEKVEAPPSAAEIVDKYVDTLTTAPGKARAAAGAVEERSEAEKKALKALE